MIEIGPFFSTIDVLCDDLEVKVTDLEFFNVKVWLKSFQSFVVS